MTELTKMVHVLMLAKFCGQISKSIKHRAQKKKKKFHMQNACRKKGSLTVLCFLKGFDLEPSLLAINT